MARRQAKAGILLWPSGLRGPHVHHLQASGQDCVASCFLGDRPPIPLRVSHTQVCLHLLTRDAGMPRLAGGCNI